MNRTDLGELLARTDLAGLLTELTGDPVGPVGRARWRCPELDHPDNDPSVTMFTDRHGVERWRCWSGDHHGTAIDAVIAARHTSVGDAIRWLGERTGTEPPRPAPRPTPRPDPARPEPSPALQRWVHHAARRLWTPAGAVALAALRDRTISDDVIVANRLGAHPRGNTTGLPRWSGITIPSYGPDGRLVFAQSRNLDRAAPSKYTNPRPAHAAVPPVTFPRGGPASGPLVVTEGVLDGLVATSAGYRCASVISAAYITPAAVTAIAARAAHQPIVVALDGDPAGRTASARLTKALRDLGADVHDLALPDGHDLTSLHQQHHAHLHTAVAAHAATR